MTMAGMTRCCTRPEPVDLLVDGLAAYRLTRLLTLDSLPPVKHARDKVLARWGESEWSELAVCPWCMSAYVAVAVVAARHFTPRTWSPLARVLAASAVTGWLASRE